jgi:hypothetical protein
MAKAKYTPNTQSLRTVLDFTTAQRRLSSRFLYRKLALAAIALKAKGMSSGEIAKALDLPKSHDVDNAIALFTREDK